MSLSYKGYTGSAEFDAENDVWTGYIEDIEDVVGYEASTKEKLQGVFEMSVDVYMAMKAAINAMKEDEENGASPSVFSLN